MQSIPPRITILFDAALVEKGVPLSAHFHYRKWLRYYLDFCFNTHNDPVKNESFAPFAIKLKDKNQSEQQRKQAFDAVSIFYQIEKGKPDQDGALLLKNKNQHISTKNTKINSTHADWRPVYSGLDSEIQLRHYSQACIRPHLSPQFRQSSIAGQLRYPNRSAASGAQRREDDHDLYPYDPKPDDQRGQKST